MLISIDLSAIKNLPVDSHWHWQQLSTKQHHVEDKTGSFEDNRKFEFYVM